MLFKNYPYIVMEAYNGDKHMLTDIMTRVYYRSGFDNEKALYTFYDIKAGEKPEDVSFNFYGSQEYHWIILLFNEILNPYQEWYSSEDEVISYTENNYDDINGIHHYEHEGFNNSVGLGTPITNIDYEISQNELRRRIKILNGRYINIFLDEFNKTI